MNRVFRWIVLGTVLAIASPAIAVDANIEQSRRFDELLDAGQGQQAVAQLQSMKVKFAEHPQVMACDAQIMLLQNNAAGATTLLNKVLEKEPNHARASALLAGIEFRMGKGDAARTRIDAALAVHPDAPELLQMAGEIRMIQQEVDAAIPIWQKLKDNAAALPGQKATALVQLGSIAVQQQKPAEALACLKPALALRWHPNVAFAIIQQLKLTGQNAEALAAISDFKAKFDMPQLQQLRPQAMSQVTPIEVELRLLKIDEDLRNPEVETITVGFEIDSIQRSLSDITDAQVRASAQKMIDRRKMMKQVALLRYGIKQKYSSEWVLQIAEEIEKYAADASGPDVDEAMAFVKDARQAAVAADEEKTVIALELAQQGWTIADFSQGYGDKADELKKRGLPERYRDFPQSIRDALKKHYEVLAKEREKVELEAAVEAFIQSPSDGNLQQRVVELVAERVAKIEDPASTELTFEKIIPAQIWVEHHPYARNLNINDELSDKREMCYTVWNDIPSGLMRENHEWAELIESYTRAIKLYPRWQTLWGRAQAHMYAGNFQQAYEDSAAAVAVAAWEMANSIGSPDTMNGNWAVEGIGPMLAMRDLADGEPSSVDSERVWTYLQSLDYEDYSTAAWTLTNEHPKNSMMAQFASSARFENIFKTDLLDALARDYDFAETDEVREDILARAEKLGSYSHAGFGYIEAMRKTDLEQRKSFLQVALSDDPRHARAALELGKLLENEGKTRDAMLYYNVAAGGMRADDLSDEAKEAALARDRLEGPIPDFNAAVKIYEPIVKELADITQKDQYAKRESGQYEAVVERLRVFGVNPKFFFANRADARRGIGDYHGAIDDLAELAQIDPDNAAHYAAMRGQFHIKAGQDREAINWFTQAIDSGNTKDWIYFARADANNRVGNYQAALDDYNTTIELKPDHARALEARSKYYEYIVRDYDSALADAEAALAILKEKYPDADFFELDLRVNNMNMIILRRQIDSAFAE